jgi:predicted GIY-YIG superfamily endonuclease
VVCYRVYILQNVAGRFHFDLSENVLKRLEQHNLGLSHCMNGKDPGELLE